MINWQSLSTLPEEGTFLILSSAPTNWAYSVATKPFYKSDGRMRAMKLNWAIAWAEFDKDEAQKAHEKHFREVKERLAHD